VTVGHVGSMVDEYRSSGVPFLRSTNILPYRLDTADVVYIGRGFHERLRKSALRPGDLVVVRTGKPGTACVIPESLGEANCSDLVIVRPGKRADARFLAYFINGMAAGHVEAFAVGAVQQHFNIGEAKRLPVPALHVDVQRAIGEVLGALDDKVELNRRMNRTLEEMASALFKSWFVDFDPIVAKADGRKPFEMDAATAALFPGAFEPGAEGDYPLGWRWVSLGDITEKIGSGATPTGGASVYRDEGVSLIRSQNVYDFQFIWDGLAHIGDEHAKALAGVTVFPKDVLINITGASFLRTCVVDPGVLPARVNQHVAIVRAAKGVPPHFLHLNLVRPWMKEFLAGHDAGGSRQAITKAHLEGVPILLPGEGVLGEFEGRTNPWFELIEANIRESRTLTALRDTLLPKLLSGEVRLKQAEKLVGAAL
jgi:type I restriction enzyme S subunit